MKPSDIKDQIVEILWLIKTCLTTVWFWLPTLYAAYFYIQLWMIFNIHPLTILILPAILGAYLTIEEKRRMEAKYQISSSANRTRTLKLCGSEGLQHMSLPWKIQNRIEEYEQKYKKDKTQKESL